MDNINFIKMHGLGNDFVILDSRLGSITLQPKEISLIADRHIGVGCDQIVIMLPSQDDLADIFIKIFNSDGSETFACGNATRCVASLLMKELKKDHVTVETMSGLLDAELNSGTSVALNIGKASFNWKDIPLSESLDTANINIPKMKFRDGFAVNLGNTHIVFFENDVEKLDLKKDAPAIENHKFFPERVNVNFAQIITKNKIRLRVWERGAGETLACGTGACATVAASFKKGLTDSNVLVLLDGGSLDVQFLNDGHLVMIGDVSRVFDGTIDKAIFKSGN